MSNTILLFPGQGSQSVGMLNDFLADSAVVRDTLAEADHALGYALSTLMAQGPAEDLDRTEHTQPAMLAADVALYRHWRAEGGAAPVAVAGHSLGEYAALVAAEVMSFSDALRLARIRAQAMQAAVPEGHGAMAAVVGLDDEAVQALCDRYADGQVLEPVNFNAPGQVVIAGEADAVARASEHAKGHGARMVVQLPVSVPSHCQLMLPAANALREALRDVPLAAPCCPVIQNVSAAPPEDTDALREQLIDQVRAPVRWVETIQYLATIDNPRFLECGPGKVLTGLMRRINRSLAASALGEPVALNKALAA